MFKPVLVIFAVFVCLAAVVNSSAMDGARRVVVYNDAATDVDAPPASIAGGTSGDLWITLADLTRATKFVLKPQGVCRDELCFPIPKSRKEAFLNKQGKTTWFNLSEFARLVRQPVAFDAEQGVWYFGPRADEQNSYTGTLDAPNFTLPDVNGKMHSLSDFRGKKVMLITWASW